MRTTRNRRSRKSKPFDCVEMKRRVQAKIHAEIRGLTREEELTYWREHAKRGPRGAEWREAYRRATGSRPKPSSSPRRRRGR
jgi:hypothetical protein